MPAVTARARVAGSVRGSRTSGPARLRMASRVSRASRDQLGARALHARVASHVGRARQGVLDRPPRHLAGRDHILGGRGMVGLGVTDHVHDVRLERHLQVDVVAARWPRAASGSSG